MSSHPLLSGFLPRLQLLFAGSLLLTCLVAPAADAQQARIAPTADGLTLIDGNDKIEIRLLEDGLASVHLLPGGQATPATPVLAPHPSFHAPTVIARSQSADAYQLSTPQLRVRIDLRAPHAIAFLDASGVEFLHAAHPLTDARTRSIGLTRADAEPLYGVHGIGLHETDGTVTRDQGGLVEAGIQGNSGAPFTFTAHYGLLVDSDGGQFQNAQGSIGFLRDSRPDVEFFVFHGQPLATMAALSRLVGPPPMPPLWTLGFLNSQWGSDQAEVKNILTTYRQRHLPIDGFIFDFDWKAWGEDNYGEWRWNSTRGPGAVAPDKFPDGQSGQFAAWAASLGVHLGGILKPRILTTIADGKTPTEAAAYATAHNFWYPGQKIIPDYFSHRLARDIDFNNPEARAWYWQHLEPAFRAGMAGFWLDEADESGGIPFNNLQFLNMGRAIYDGQRACSNQRVWTINRNFYLGASRYGYAGWSGDIDSGFDSMALQRRRMIAALNTGEFHWSMDTGGFHGHPSNENYARWIEFAAFVPILRVHGDLDEKRQPWVYGPVAEAAARHALELRYSLIPYIYSLERQTTEGEIGLVRPLAWQFPTDPVAASQQNEWMFGPALLVSPVVNPGETAHSVYLPAGTWWNYATGQKLDGGRTLQLATDSHNWSDIPLFVRSGSILATGPALDYTGQKPLTELTLDLFPAADEARFLAYDDDGATYDYEHGGYLRQPITTRTTPTGQTLVRIEPATGHYKSPLATYLLRIHTTATAVRLNGKPLRQTEGSQIGQNAKPDSPSHSSPAEGHWTATTDRFGPVVLVRLPAGGATPRTLELAH